MCKGLSTSMPEDVQLGILRSIPGLEKVEMMRTGYAIEYDAVVPTQLWPSLETKLVRAYSRLGKLMEHLDMKKLRVKVLWLGLMLLVKCKGKNRLLLIVRKAILAF